MGGAEEKYVQDAFKTNWISPVGPHIAEFEKQLASYVGVDHCAALSSGTAAIHLALIVLGIKPGDEVICSSFTFSGSCNPVVYQGATPVFIDSESDTWNMDPNLLREAIADRIKKGKKPGAIIVVHLYGMPSKMEEIMNIAREHGIPVVEDAAEAMGAHLNKKMMGSFGDIGILSFNGNKIITTSGGGALLSNNEALVKKVRFLATQARDPAPHYEHTEIGYNYRLSNVCAAIGLGQLEVINERVQQRRRIFEYYTKKLSVSGKVHFLPEKAGFFSNRWLTTVLIEDNNGKSATDVRVALEVENIESRPLWKPMHLQPVYRNAPYFGGTVSEKLFKEGLCLPSGSALTDAQLGRITHHILEVIA